MQLLQHLLSTWSVLQKVLEPKTFRLSLLSCSTPKQGHLVRDHRPPTVHSRGANTTGQTAEPQKGRAETLTTRTPQAGNTKLLSCRRPWTRVNLGPRFQSRLIFHLLPREAQFSRVYNFGTMKGTGKLLSLKYNLANGNLFLRDKCHSLIILPHSPQKAASESVSFRVLISFLYAASQETTPSCILEQEQFGALTTCTSDGV